MKKTDESTWVVKVKEAGNSRWSNLGDLFLDMARRVVRGELATHDDRSMLVPKEQLIDALGGISPRDIQQLIDNQLIIPVENDEMGTPLFHVANCIEFLRFLEKLEQMGFPLMLQQPIAEMYHSVLWALYSDIDYEISNFINEHGRQPSKLELAYLRVINEFAVANFVTRMEEDIIAGKADELKEAKEKAARWKRAILKEAKFGVAESEIEKIIAAVWKPPLQYYRGREIKAFIDMNSIRWTKEELSLIWGGHFDFALCNENGLLCLAIEYQGKGHYGKSNEGMKKVSRRDIVKQAICDKAGVPLVQLDSEYAFIERYKQLFQHFLSVFLKRRYDYDPVITLLREQLDRICSKSTTSALVDPRLVNIRHRLDIYEIQGKGKSILGLLWDLHKVQALLSPLPTMLGKLNC